MLYPPTRLPKAALWEELRIPAALAVIAAACFAWHFRDYMPLPEGWGRVETWLFPLSMADLAFHEAGHPVFGILGFGNQFITAAGGTLMQLLIPSICMFEFARRRSFAGILFVLFWLGENLINISYYMADARQQVIILITGMSGSEGGMHDWHTMLGALGLSGYCVGLGQTVFFAGCFLMALAPLCGFFAFIRRAGSTGAGLWPRNR